MVDKQPRGAGWRRRGQTLAGASRGHWTLGIMLALKALKDLSAKTLVLFISQILPWPFWGLQPVLENLFFFLRAAVS